MLIITPEASIGMYVIIEKIATIKGYMNLFLW